MSLQSRPFSPETLANRWGCSSEKIRQMYHLGELHGFRLGRLIRIPANEVERVECQNTDLSDTESNGASLTPNREEAAFASRLERLTRDLPRPELAQSGARAQGPSRNG
jgi:excisionase family DNA binding protein